MVKDSSSSSSSPLTPYVVKAFYYLFVNRSPLSSILSGHLSAPSSHPKIFPLSLLSKLLAASMSSLIFVILLLVIMCLQHVLDRPIFSQSAYMSMSDAWLTLCDVSQCFLLHCVSYYLAPYFTQMFYYLSVNDSVMFCLSNPCCA